MQHDYFLENVRKVTKQRNFLLFFCCFMLVTEALLGVAFVLSRQKVVMVPWIDREYRVSGDKVSRSYLEEMTYMFLSGLLDLTPQNVKYKKELVLKHTIAGNIRAINKYFTEAQTQHEQFQFSTYFTVKNLEITPGKLEVIAGGILSSRFGREGVEEKEVKYRLRYKMIGGILKLKSFNMMQDGGN